MFGSLGVPEIVLIFVVALLLFGPRKLPHIGRSIGRALGEFRRASNEFKRTIEDEVAVDDIREVERDLRTAATSVRETAESMVVGNEPLESDPPAPAAGESPAAEEP